MSNILTPVSLWKNFDDSLDVQPQTVSQKTEDGVKTEYMYISGRETGSGRVKIFAALACGESTVSGDAVIILPHSDGTIDEELMRFFVKQGYTVLMPDYRGAADGLENFTVYPEEVEYANALRCGRHRDYVDEDAYHTSWYEWVAVARYAFAYLSQRDDIKKIGAVGIRDGGEIVWKLAATADLACAVTVCAAGWQAYRGYNKFGLEEPALDEERHRFIAGIDSQAYAPFVRCPVLMLCSTNDELFDYDRAYDTFSRINEKFIGQSMISYSVHCNGCIDAGSTNDMSLFLDKFVKERQVFLPKPAVISVLADDQQNLIAHVEFDEHGVIEDFGVYMAEDCADPALREWVSCKHKGGSGNEHDYFLNIYEKTSVVYAFSYARYTNGFISWSRMAVKKVSGKFRNMRKKCRVMYTSTNGLDSFSIAERSSAVSGVFLTSDDVLPHLVEKSDGIKGLYSECGLLTFIFNNPCFQPDEDSMLKLDVYCDVNAKITFVFEEVGGTVYSATVEATGGVWQSFVFQSKDFCNDKGIHLQNFCGKCRFAILSGERFAINNAMWL